MQQVVGAENCIRKWQLDIFVGRYGDVHLVKKKNCSVRLDNITV